MCSAVVQFDVQYPSLSRRSWLSTTFKCCIHSTVQVLSLRERRDALRRQRNDLDRSAAALKEKFKRLESELFRRLRDESGREYDPNLFALLQTDDGGVFIVPRTNTTNERAATSDKSQDEKSGRKRKSKRKE